LSPRSVSKSIVGFAMGFQLISANIESDSLPLAVVVGVLWGGICGLWWAFDEG
jgi:hypothetical protein